MSEPQSSRYHFFSRFTYFIRLLIITAVAEYDLRGKTHLPYMIAEPSLSIELMLDNKIML